MNVPNFMVLSIRVALMILRQYTIAIVLKVTTHNVANHFDDKAHNPTSSLMEGCEARGDVGKDVHVN